MFIKISLSISVALLSACVTGPKPKNVLNNLNGEYYNNTVEGEPAVKMTPIPLLLERKQRDLKISGQLTLIMGDLPVPLGNQILDLSKDSKLVVATVTKGDGSFLVSYGFTPGDYKITLRSKKYQTEQTLKIQDSDISRVSLQAVERKQ